MSTDLLVIVDNSSGAFSYSWSGGNSTSPWDIGSLPQWYGGTTQYPNSAPTRIGSFTFTFNGTSAAFIGNTSPSSQPQNATIQIDSGTSFTINYPTTTTYMQWYTTPTLPEGRHTITMSNLYQIAIDYAVVKVGSQTSLTGQTVIVDDDNSLIQYSGQWSRSASRFLPGSLPSGYPYGNITHRSSNPGDTFTFQFSGTSIAVYGIFSWANLGSLTTTYTLDGTVFSSPITVTTSSPGFSDKDGDVSNYVHFSRDNLSSGAHTLVVNVTEARNQSFILDYITYKPSFDTLSLMPSLSPIASSGTASQTSSTSPSASSVTSSGGSQKSVSTGAIVGGVLGGVAFGVLVTVLAVLFVLRRRRSREEDYASSFHDETHPQTINSSQMQERQSAFYSPPPNRPAKFTHSGPGVISPVDSATTRIQSSITGNSMGVEETLANPPSYDAVSNRVQGRTLKPSENPLWANPS